MLTILNINNADKAREQADITDCFWQTSYVKIMQQRAKNTTFFCLYYK